ncbi:MAG TPA: tRNA (adenosine(37)-N6)-threonylcarbamoyltransferase complex dimerization subunit type 1 TsaB [Planctomycetota bacterium]|jgi:tRNA threonylcarbamoyl adenosine modification protein YeaZ
MMPSPLLAIETSGKSLGVALRAERGMLFNENVVAGSVHGKALAPLIQQALSVNGLKPAELSGVAVSLGPGSWTGLRIGISAAKALAWGAGIPLIGVPSFEAMALDAVWHGQAAPRPFVAQIARESGALPHGQSAGANGRSGSLPVPHQRAWLLLRDARSEGCFAALFGETDGAPQRWIEETVLKASELIATVKQELAQHPGTTLAIGGDGVCQEALSAAARENGWVLLPGCEHVSAGAVAECGWRRLEAGQAWRTAAEIHAARPLYLRASDPELRLKRKKM